MPWTVISESDKFIYNNSEQIENSRMISYADAIREALSQAMELDKNVFLMGQGINDKVGMFGATTGLCKEFGKQRVFETPLAETGMTGVAVGAAIAGMRPFYCHNRPDFLTLSMDQIINHASKYNYMSGGQCNVPLVIWAVTGQGWGSAAQHSQAFHGLFMHIPGLKIVMPTTPYDAKGLVLSAIADNNPVLILDHRKLFNTEGYVPEKIYKIPIGKGVIRREGTTVTIVAISAMVMEAIKAAEILAAQGISAEIIDLRTMKPYDKDIIIESVKKTRHLVIADTGWKTAGAASEIAAVIYEEAFGILDNSIEIVALPDIPTPASYILENEFYPDKDSICSAVMRTIGVFEGK